MNQTIPLNKLILSPRNVRHTNGDEDIDSLAESIASKGLLQNLVVSESVDQPGKHEVDAGGRRWRALNLLAADKRIARNFPVPVHIIPRDDALEASLVENLQKVAMNPADEVEAFHAIVHQGSNALSAIDNVPSRIANCARRFGRTERYVEQRLRLAALAPDILTALREYRITIEAARAYASHPDPVAQLYVFAKEDEKGEWGHKPANIRDALAGKSYPTDHRLVRYIGLQAYIDAGGRTERDLFFGDDDREILIDIAIVKKLAADKALAQAEYQAHKAGWGGAALCPVDGPSWGLPKAPKGFETKWSTNVADLPLVEKIIAAAIYRINHEADGVELVSNQWFKPITPVEPGAEASSPHANVRDWQAEERAEQIRTIAARLAAPQVAGSLLEGKAFWPNEERNWVYVLEETEDGIFVALMVRVDPADLDERLAQAEHEYEAAKAAREAEREAQRAAREAGLAGVEPITTADQAANGELAA